jgi:hypothetical protein
VPTDLIRLDDAVSLARSHTLRQQHAISKRVVVNTCVKIDLLNLSQNYNIKETESFILLC